MTFYCMAYYGNVFFRFSIKLLKFLFVTVIVMLLILKRSLASNIDAVHNINSKLSDEQLYEGTLYHLDMKEMADLSEKNRSLGLKNYKRVNVGGHFVTKSTDDKSVFDSVTRSNGASAQYINTCLLNSTDNFFYLNTIGTDSNDNIVYSDFSKKLHSSKDIRLFYYTLELYEIGKYNKVTYEYNNNEESLDDRLNDFINNVIMTNDSDIILKNGVSANDYIKSFEQLFISYGLDDPNRPITQDEFKVYMYKLFTDIKNDLGLAGEFDPSVDTPHLVDVLGSNSSDEIELTDVKEKLPEIEDNFEDINDNSEDDVNDNSEDNSRDNIDDNIDENSENDTEKNKDIVKVIEIGAIKSIYEITRKTPNSFYYLDNIKQKGLYATLDYANGKNYINNVNLSVGYEYSMNDSNIFFYGTNFGAESAELKYGDRIKTVYSLSTIDYVKLDTNVLSMDSGIFIEDFFDKNVMDSFKKYKNNYKIGYFIGLNKKMGSDKNFLKISSRLFDTRVKVGEMRSFINGEFDNSLLYRNLYVENVVELNIKYLDNRDFNFIPSIKYIVNANNKKKTTYITLNNDKNNIEIKNKDEFYISLVNKMAILNSSIFVIGLDLSKVNYDLYVRFAKNF